MRAERQVAELKRSEKLDSHERYANIRITYLLERMEDFTFPLHADTC
jgi:hypothetical protein